MQETQFGSTIKTMTMAPDKIGFFRFLLEAYDNMAVLTTLDEQQGLVVLRFPAGNLPEVEEMLAALPSHLALASVPEPPISVGPISVDQMSVCQVEN